MKIVISKSWGARKFIENDSGNKLLLDHYLDGAIEEEAIMKMYTSLVSYYISCSAPR
jgi:hypothetical protein